MSPSEREALENAEDIVAIANAMFRIKAHDHRRTAVGLLTVMQTLLADDVTGRIALATLMAEAIGELLAGLPSEETVNVPRWWN